MTDWLLRPCSGSGIGREIHGLVPALRYSRDESAWIRQAFRQHRVLLIRRFPADLAYQVALTESIGQPVRASGTIDETPSPVLVRVETENDLNPYNALWHSDRSWSGTPVGVTVLYASRAQTGCPATELADMCDLAAQLSAAERELLSAEYMVHDVLKSRQLHAGGWRHLQQLPPSLAIRMVRRRLRYYRAKFRGSAANAEPTARRAVHPLLAKSPVSGQDYVYLGEHAWRLQGKRGSHHEAAQLLQALRKKITPAFEHRWSTGDLLVFDNLTLLHRREPLAVSVLGSTSYPQRELRRTLAWLDEQQPDTR